METNMNEVYIVGKLEGCYKIGRSDDAQRRLLSFEPKLPVSLTIVHRIKCDNEVWAERVLHTAFLHCRMRGEWFKLTAQELADLTSISRFSNEADLPRWVMDNCSRNGGLPCKESVSIVGCKPKRAAAAATKQNQEDPYDDKTWTKWFGGVISPEGWIVVHRQSGKFLKRDPATNRLVDAVNLAQEERNRIWKLIADFIVGDSRNMHSTWYHRWEMNEYRTKAKLSQ